MNNQYKQLGKIFLERTNPSNPAARRDIKGAKKRAKKSKQSWKRGSLRRGLAADDARVRRGEKPRHTTKAQGQEAMRLDPDHPATRRTNEDIWTIYSDLAYILAEGRRIERLKKGAGVAALVGGALVGGARSQDAQQSQAPTSQVGGSARPRPPQPLITRSRPRETRSRAEIERSTRAEEQQPPFTRATGHKLTSPQGERVGKYKAKYWVGGRRGRPDPMAGQRARRRQRMGGEDINTTKLPHGQTGEGKKRGIRRGGGRRSKDWRSGYSGRHESVSVWNTYRELGLLFSEAWTPPEKSK